MSIIKLQIEGRLFLGALTRPVDEGFDSRQGTVEHAAGFKIRKPIILVFETEVVAILKSHVLNEERAGNPLPF